MNKQNEITKILQSDDRKAIRALFSFDKGDDNEVVAFKFNLWARYFLNKYFSSKDAPYHHEIDKYNIQAYRGQIDSFTNITFRGGGKDARTKLFIAFAILNDLDHFRRYIKILTADASNSSQTTTDIYNILVSRRILQFYPETFEKSNQKREERMNSFTTSFGVKVTADTTGTDQRGAIQEEARPGLLWLNDFETRNTLRSAVTTKAIWDNIEEARTGLSIDGAFIATCNYISEMGNVHKLVSRQNERNIVLIVPIIDENGVIAWPDRYTKEDIENMKAVDDDFEGEKLCKPSASKDILFDRAALEKMKPRTPIREISGFKIFYEYDPSHRYGSGHDVAGGVGLDSSTSVFIDFSTVPARVVATFASNTIKPDVFGDEINREGAYFGMPICAIEKNNHGHATIARAKQLGVNLYATESKDTKIEAGQATEYGWNNNSATKPQVIFDLVKACNDGLLDLSDSAIIRECMSYTRNDIMNKEVDPRLTTRHFDLLMATAIAWKMRNHAESAELDIDYDELEYHPRNKSIGI